MTEIFCPVEKKMVKVPVFSIDPANFVPRRGLLTRYGKKAWAEHRVSMSCVSEPTRPEKYRSIDAEWW